MPGEPVGRRVPLLPARGSALRWCFDGFYAVALPPVLIVLDNEWHPLGFDLQLLPYRPTTPLLAFGAILALLAWWTVRPRAAWLGAFAAGPLLLGAAFALGTGLFLLPASLLGILLLGVGLLGLVPFLTGASFLDAGFEALHAGRARFGGFRTAVFALGTALVFGLGCAGTGGLLRTVEIRETAILAGDEAGDPARAESVLRVLHSCPGAALSELMWAARDAEERAPEKGKRLAEAYERITGHPLPTLD